MIDLHCHMLPGIDDGPKTMDQSLAMARFAVEHGITHSVLTPHIHPGCYDNDYNKIRAVFETFQALLAEENIPLEIGMAAEVRVCAELPMMIAQKKIPFLGEWQGMKVMLLEFPHENLTVGAEKLIGWLMDRNILPLIAHPERNQSVMRQPDRIKPYKEMGCLLQITAGSITGLFGEASQKCALTYIEQDAAFVIATDAHNLHKRQPTLQSAKEFLLPIFGEDKVNSLLVSNPASILQNYIIDNNKEIINSAFVGEAA